MKRNITVFLLVCGIFFSFLMAGTLAEAQYAVFAKKDIIEYTSEWKGERYPNGRPKVPDEILERMKKVSLEEAWAVLRRNEYHNQFEGNWMSSHSDPVLVGRAVTAVFMPHRPDIDIINKAKGKANGFVGNFQSWVISTMVEGDVFVVDLMNRVVDAPIFGDNLGNAIYGKGGRGCIFNGGSRDLEGIRRNLPDDFEVFVRGWDPSYNPSEGKMGMMGMGMNLPINIGRAMVMPGDVVLAKEGGIIFIPPHLALEVVDSSEIIQIRDKFGFERLRAGTYTPGQIDARWTDEIFKDFVQWMEQQGSAITPRQKELLLKGRTW